MRIDVPAAGMRAPIADKFVRAVRFAVSVPARVNPVKIRRNPVLPECTELADHLRRGHGTPRGDAKRSLFRNFVLPHRRKLVFHQAAECIVSLLGSVFVWKDHHGGGAYPLARLQIEIRVRQSGIDGQPARIVHREARRPVTRPADGK